MTYVKDVLSFLLLIIVEIFNGETYFQTDLYREGLRG